MALSSGFCYNSDVVNPEIMQIQGCFESSNPYMFVEMNQNENNSAHSFHPQQAMQEFHMIRNSNYLIPTQQLLNEFCSLHVQADISKQKPPKPPKQWNHDDEKQQCSVYSLDLMELQKRNTKLLSMLQRVDRRYKHYCDQMKGVVSSFEAIAGDGAASVYSKLASTAMSRHFRCLRDGIIRQIQETNKAMGDKDINRAGMGTSRGETPRLRVLDQTLRQQKSFQQIGFIENHPWKAQRGLPEKSVFLLRAWLFEHFLHPYPSDIDKHILARQTGLSRSQVSNWFINARVRLWKPMVEEMYLEETKEHEDPDAIIDQYNLADQKPTPSQLLRVDPDSLSSIIQNNQDKTHHQQQTFGCFDNNVELDFSSYNPSTAENGGSRGGVSLTLGLQQHGGNGVSSAQSSLFCTQESIEQDSHYSFLDGEGETLLYRNSVGAQLLHDLAG